MEIKLKKIVDNLRTATLLPRQCTDRRDVNEKKGQKVKSSKKQKDTENPCCDFLNHHTLLLKVCNEIL